MSRKSRWKISGMLFQKVFDSIRALNLEIGTMLRNSSPWPNPMWKL